MAQETKYDRQANEAAFERAQAAGRASITKPRPVVRGGVVKESSRPQQPGANSSAYGRISAADASKEFVRANPSYSRGQMLSYVASRCGLSLKAAEAALIG